MPYDIFLLSIVKDYEADVFIWRYNYPWHNLTNFDKNYLEVWNKEQSSILAALNKSKKNIILINENVVSLSTALNKLLNKNEYNSDEQLPTNDNITRNLYLSVFSVWGKKYWATLKQLEKISLSFNGGTELVNNKQTQKSDDILSTWLNFLSNAQEIYNEKNDLQIKLNQRFKELAKLTLLLESKQSIYNNELENLKNHNKQLLKKNESIEREFNDYKHNEINLSSEISSRDFQLSEMKKEIIAERNISHSYHKKIENLTEELSLCKASLNNRFRELALITGMLENSKREAIKLEEKLLLASNKNANIKKSISWKLTAPIRALHNPIGSRKKKDKRTNKSIQLIKSSKLFDPKWYLEQYPDVKATGIEPARHYLLFGGFENRDPSLIFSSQGYLDLYPDVKNSGMNPLEHYIRYGEIEKRTIVTKQ